MRSLIVITLYSGSSESIDASSDRQASRSLSQERAAVVIKFGSRWRFCGDPSDPRPVGGSCDPSDPRPGWTVCVIRPIRVPLAVCVIRPIGVPLTVCVIRPIRVPLTVCVIRPIGVPVGRFV